MPTMTSWSRYLSCSLMRSGISARHGGHHVAQKFSRTTLPRQELEGTVRPLRSVTEKAGSGVGSLGTDTSVASGRIGAGEGVPVLVGHGIAADSLRQPDREAGGRSAWPTV